MPTDCATSTHPTTAPSLSRQVLSLALPALGALIAEPIFVLIDSAMVGHLGTAPLAGLGVASTVVQTVVYLFVFLLFSTTTSAAQAYGRRDIPRALTTGIQAVYLALFIGLALAAFLFFGAPWILSFFQATPEALPHALAYLRTSAPGIVGMFVVMAATGTLRGMHDTRAALVVSILGAGLNIVLNAFLIYGLELGVAGSGAGTSITQLLMAAALVVLMGVRAHNLHIKFAPPSVLFEAPAPSSRSHAPSTSFAEASLPSLRSQVSLRPSLAGVRSSVRDGAWLLVRTVALRIALMSTLFVATQMGVLALAAHHIAWTVWGFAAYALDALAIAGQTLFASASSHATAPARTADRSTAATTGASTATSTASAQGTPPTLASTPALDTAPDVTQPGPQDPSPGELLRLLTRWGLWMGATLGVALAAVSPALPRFFTADPAVVSAALAPLLIAAATMPVASVVFLYDGIMMGAERAAYLATWGMVLLLAHLPALWLVGVASPHMAPSWGLALLWAEYSVVFLGGRALYLWMGSRDLRA